MKLQALGLQRYQKRNSGTGVFPVNFAIFLRVHFLQDNFGRLLLKELQRKPYFEDVIIITQNMV